MTPDPTPSVATLRQLVRSAARGLLTHGRLGDPHAFGRKWEAALWESLMEEALNVGDAVMAYEFASRGLEVAGAAGWPLADLRVGQALALARTGAIRAAQARMREAVEAGAECPRTLGLLARTYRDLAREHPPGEERRRLYGEALACAARGYDHEKNPYNANQAAQFAWLAEQPDVSRHYQNLVLSMWESLGSAGYDSLDEEEKFWWHTNRAEMALLRGDLETAAAQYQRMRDLGQSRLASVGANAKVCRDLLRGADLAPNLLDDCFRLPSLVIASGHIFDEPGRTPPRFPIARATAVREALSRQLGLWQPGEGLVSSSAGADLLAAEALLEQSAPLRLVLPMNPATIETRCHRGPLAAHGLSHEELEKWIDRYRRIVAGARHIKQPARLGPDRGMPDDLTASQPAVDLNHDLDFAHTNRLLLGLGRLAAASKGWPLRVLAVWDERPAPVAPGGTAEFVALCRQYLGVEPHIINPLVDSPIRLAETAPNPAAIAASNTTKIQANNLPAPRLTPTDESARACVTFLFADLKGSTQVPESEVPAFMRRFFGGAAAILKSSTPPARLANTWGDALFAVYNSALDAAHAAKRLQQWARAGFPDPAHPSTSVSSQVTDSGPFLRIGLHSGLATVGYDPVIGQESFFGPHLILAARLEPIAEAGQILVTEDVAALVALAGASSHFEFVYQGITPLPKGFGQLGVYRMV